MSKTLLIDADVICYQIAFRNQIDVDWDWDGVKTPITYEEKVIPDIEDFIGGLLEKTRCEDYIIILSDRKHNFRMDVSSGTYKSNRKNSVKPELWLNIREVLESDFLGCPVECWDNLEGDDVLGIMATNPEDAREFIVATIDKDLRTVCCDLFLFNKPDLGVMPIDKDFSLRFFMTQVLTGDPVDGYKGLPRVGAVGAKKILDDLSEPREMWEAIVAAYESKGLTEEDALIQARQAYILQHGDYNNKTGEINLWTIETSLRNYKRS